MNLSISKVFWLFWLFSPFGPPKKLKQPSTVALSVAKFSFLIVQLLCWPCWHDLDRPLSDSRTVHFRKPFTLTHWPFTSTKDSPIFHFRTVHFHKLSTVRQSLWPQVLGAQDRSQRPILCVSFILTVKIWPMTVHISHSDIWISHFYWSGYHLEYNIEIRNFRI